MQKKFILPESIKEEFKYTAYPIRNIVSDGEYQVKDVIIKDHFDSLLATKNAPVALAQLILLNEIYDLNLPIILESTMSKIDTEYIKRYI